LVGVIGQQPWLWSREVVKNQAQIQPNIAAWITAMQRVAMCRAILATGVENFCYCDTDSLITACPNPEQMLEVGPEYGQWKMEHQKAEIIVAAPKVYGERINGKVVAMVAKGLPVAKITWSMMERSIQGSQQSVEFQQAVGLLSVLSGDRKTFVKTSSRALPLPTSSLGWHVGAEGQYLPLDVQEEFKLAEQKHHAHFDRPTKRQLKAKASYSEDRSVQAHREELRQQLRGFG
jgi:hypothetical protein